MEFTVEKFNKVKKEAEKFYNKLDKVKCPYFGDYIYFNTKGWEHLIFKEWNKTRSINDQFTRFKYLKLIPEIISQSKTLQGIWSTQKFERIHRKEEWIKILKHIDNEKKFFLSIIPFWGVNKSTGERIMYNGNPEVD
jgi:hypothetical protein